MADVAFADTDGTCRSIYSYLSEADLAMWTPCIKENIMFKGLILWLLGVPLILVIGLKLFGVL